MSDSSSVTSEQQSANLLHRVNAAISWPFVKRVITFAFFGLVAYLLYDRASSIEWDKVGEALKNTSPLKLATATGLGFLCYLVYSSFDLFGRHLLHLKIHPAKSLLAGWISYACNLNFGSLIGSVAFRYRLYSRLGVASSDVTRILGVSIATNWLGYIFLAGCLFVSGSIEPPADWSIDQMILRIIGVAFLLIVSSYLLFCTFSTKREFAFRSNSFTLPTIKIASLQLLVACVHWTLMASVIYQFFSSELAFPTVFAVLLVSALAGAVSHVPGGLGVLEAVFIALLGGQLDKHTILAGVLAYRSVFYLVPLAITLPIYLGFERYFDGEGESESHAIKPAAAK